MTTHASPVSLSYVAALRGVKPRRPGEAFAYAEVNCDDPNLLACLAASNPEGQFYGVVADDTKRLQADAAARERDVKNVTFLSGRLADVLANGNLSGLDYLSCDESKLGLPPLERQALFNLAEKSLKPGGLFNYSYRALEKDGALRFLVRELAPEMNGTQAKEFLIELQKLGGRYFSHNAAVKTRLDACITKGQPDEFFGAFDAGEARSATFNTIVAMQPRGFAYAGDSKVAANYIELSVPVEAQTVVADCKSSPLYECIKDFALDREVRSDIWCRMPAQQSADFAELFGVFTYGITIPRDEVPATLKVEGKAIDLTSSLYTKLIDLLCLMPIGVGDFLAHPTGQGANSVDVVGALQILVACGLAQPMRGVLDATDVSSVAMPKLVGGFNRYLDKTSVTGGELWMASPIVGDAIALSARDALVMQALGRAGLVNSVSALLPELKRLAMNPAQAAAVMDVAEPTAESARNMIQDVVSKSIVQWYAYGLLEAA